VPVKDRLSSSGSQLTAARPENVVLRCRLEKLNDEWQRMVTALRDGEKEAHAAWLLLVTPRQALSELISWLQSVEKIIREGLSTSPNSSADVRCEQLKYRVHIWLQVYSDGVTWILHLSFLGLLWHVKPIQY